MADAESKQTDGPSKGYEFGTFKGVFTPSILTILGVVMYLRFGWALGNVGLNYTLLIITIASVITFLTGLSLSALATNMKVEGGGAYFIISRSLGIEAGAAVGIPLFFAQALGISFYITGFTESLTTEFPDLVRHMTEFLYLPSPAVDFCAENDTHFLGILTLVLLTALVWKSADLALKSQFIIMGAIGVSLVSFFLGGSPGELPARAAVSVGEKMTFWPVFAVIFPAVTGIEAGIAMSGDLKNPAKSLPRGTIAAVLVGYVVYVAIVVFLWFAVSNKDLLVSHPMMMRYVARWGTPILLGVWAASLSSAMGALLGAPRTLQALARDRVIPRILGRGFGAGNDPRFATGIAFVVCLSGILLGNLNQIGAVLSMFFLTSYGMLNISAGLEELTSPPSWRPKFRIPWYVSIAGAAGCFAAMFMINAGASWIAIVVAGGVYFLMQRRSLRAWWGDLRSGILMLIARNAIHGLAHRKPDERTWKPNILVLSGSPTSRWYLIRLANAIAQDKGFLTIAAVVPEDTGADRIKSLTTTMQDYLEKRDVTAIARVYPAENPMEGAQMLAKTYGYGPIAPNTLMLGMTEDPKHYHRFAKFIVHASRRRQNLVIVRENEESSPEDMEKPRIDVWWYGNRQNLGFMLAMSYLLRRSSEGKKAELVLKTIISEDDDAEQKKEIIDNFIAEARLDAGSEVILRKEGDVFDTIRENSVGAALVFLGMRHPEEDETVQNYSTYYKDLLHRSEGLPPMAIVLASEEMDFASIFDRIK